MEHAASSAPNSLWVRSGLLRKRAVIADLASDAVPRHEGARIEADLLVIGAHLLSRAVERTLALPNRDGRDVEAGWPAGLLENGVPEKARKGVEEGEIASRRREKIWARRFRNRETVESDADVGVSREIDGRHVVVGRRV